MSCCRYAPCVNVKYLSHPLFCVFRVLRRRGAPYANGRAAAGGLSCHGVLQLPSSVGLLILRWCGMLPTYVSYVFPPLLFFTGLCLLRRILGCVVGRRFISYWHSTRLHIPLWPPLRFRCPSRVRGVRFNILVRLPLYPPLFMFGVFRPRRTPYASGRVGAGRSHACVHTCGMPPPWRGLYRTLASLPSLCIVFGIVSCMAICAMAICMAWHITYSFFGGRWRCRCLCVLFLNPAPLWSPLFVVLPACAA